MHGYMVGTGYVMYMHIIMILCSQGTSPGGGAVLSVHRSGSGASDLSTSSLDRILEGDKVNKSGLLSSQEEEEGEGVKGGAGLQAALIR